MAINLINETQERIKKSFVENIVKKAFELLNLKRVSVSIVFVKSEDIRNYNKNFRNTDRVTDVLAFPSQGLKGYLGDIIICPEVVKENAAEYKVSFEEELTRVIVHGILHLIGYRDYTEEEKREMFEVQESLVRNIVGGSCEK